MSVKNSTVMSKCWLENTNDFQQRIPNPDQAGYDACVRALFDPYNNDLFNSFANMLVGMMGTYVESRLFLNPLRELKKPAETWGNTARGVAVKYFKAHSYKVNDQTLLKLEAPEFREWFYSVNQNRRYEFSWSKYELQRVFAQGDSYGFDDLLTATLNQMMSSDNYDEMQVMINAFSEANARMGGLYVNQISAAPTTKALAQELLVKVRTDAGMMQFPNMRYNHIDIPVHESTDTLIFWVTPEVDAQLDVMALADLFHLEKAEVNYRKIVIPEFPIPNVYAALTSEDFIYCRDVWYGIEPPFYNPSNRTYKYYLFHDQMVGVNPVANCVLYSTDADTAIPTVEETFSGIQFVYDQIVVPIGGKLQTFIQANGNIDPTSALAFMTVEPSACTYELTAVRPGNGVPDTLIELNSRTYVDKRGFLHTQKSGLESGDIITITAKSTYINPSTGSAEEHTAVATVMCETPSMLQSENFMIENYPYLVYSPTDNTIYID